MLWPKKIVKLQGESNTSAKFYIKSKKNESLIDDRYLLLLFLLLSK